VVKDLDEFRAVLTKPQNFRFQVTLDVHGKDFDFIAPWRNFLPNPAVRSLSETVGHSRDVRSSSATQGPFKRMLIGLPGLESSYLCQSVPGLDSFTSPDLPAILVMVKALTTMEGPFWNRIRGLGLSYGYDISPNNEEGLIYFTLDKASHLTAAYRAAKDIVTAFSEGAMKFSQGMTWTTPPPPPLRNEPLLGC
jgi:Zn-dependent M16 (insulinase) family peptidase